MRAILFLASYFLLPATLLAATSESLSAQIESLRREREALVAEQQRLQVELDKVSQESQNLGTAVKSLDASKKKLTADIKVTQSKINSANLNIQALSHDVGVAERRIDAHQKAIGTALQTLQTHDTRSLAVNIIASANFSELWRDRTELKELSENLDQEVANLLETRNILNKQKEAKEKVRAEAQSLAQALTGQKEVVEESQKAKEGLLVETKNKEALYQQLLAENRRREQEFEEDLYKLESELRIALDPSLIPDPRRGLLSWPLDKIHITTYFGQVNGTAKRLYASGSHNGVDFRAAQGTPVKAVYSGVVEGMGNTDEQKGCYSYGRWVLIKHGNGLSSVYGHLSASLVRVGQKVGVGEIIGYSGGQPRVFGSGFSTGPHLHLGLFASQGVAVRQFTQSRGCQRVEVPIADVRAYLDPLAYLPAL